MTVYIVQNQHGDFLDKENKWVSGSDANSLFRSPHHDIALNHLIEVNSKDFSLRATVVACQVDSKGRPVVADTPLPDTMSVDNEAALTDSPTEIDNLATSGSEHDIDDASDTTTAHA